MNSGHKYVHPVEERAVPLTDLNTIGSALVMAPHPDDESLGCGGTIALLRERGNAVHVLFVSDGTMSHPNSKAYPASRLRDLREQEAREALHRLGVDANACTFLRYPDRRVPANQDSGFPEAVARVATLLDEVKPTTLFMPWQRDPHPDHRACWQMGMAAVQQSCVKPRVLEYLIWLWELGTEDDLPTPGERTVWQVDIGSVMNQRNQAVAAHQSQVSHLIDDDPAAFYLSPDLLRHFEPPRELFLEATNR